MQLPPVSNPPPDPPEDALQQLAQCLLGWYGTSARDLPWRRTRDPYAIWISEIMLQQTQVDTVIPYWLRWMEKLPDLAALASATVPTLLKLWEGLGYYRRARDLQHAARIIRSRRHGRIPRTVEHWLELPGVGPYTAGAICSIAFNQPTPAVDGNVCRVLARCLGLRQTSHQAPAQRQIRVLAQRLLHAARDQAPSSARPCARLNQALMELGALLCTPKHPDCSACPWQELCSAHRLGIQTLIPKPRPRPATIRLHQQAFVITRHNQFWLRQRPEQGTNAGLWEFPTVAGHHTRAASRLRQILAHPRASQPRRASTPFPGKLRTLGVVRHSLTRYRFLIAAHVLALDGKRTQPKLEGRWCDWEELERLPLAAAHRKIARLYATVMGGASRR
jgi:A/G-specific adenine glycosylase